MPQTSTFNVRRKAKKGLSTTPETENDFQAAGVELEEAGEKWRAGDAAKSTRFFARAIEMYNAGLNKYPKSFDLAYNSARLQYELTQQPRLLQFLSKPIASLLQSALDAHRFALNISKDNADLLYNTAQVLTSLAEALGEGRIKPDGNHDEELVLFQEALELLRICLEIQLVQFKQAEKETSLTINDVDQTNPELASTKDLEFSVSRDESWATIIDPVTTDTLVDTVITQLETLSTFCSLLSAQNINGLTWIEDYFNNIIRNENTWRTDSIERKHGISLAKAKFTCAFLDARFRSGHLDVSSYEQELNNAFEQAVGNESDPQGLCDQADAELAFNTSLQASLLQSQTQGLARLNNMGWKHITKALQCLTVASKLLHAQNLSRIHLRRGDCELYRFRLGQAPNNYENASKNASTLVRNAELYYRGAAAFAKNEGTAEEEREALIKEAAAASLGDGLNRFASLSGVGEEAIMETLKDMEDEGLLSPEALSLLGKYAL